MDEENSSATKLSGIFEPKTEKQPDDGSSEQTNATLAEGLHIVYYFITSTLDKNRSLIQKIFLLQNCVVF